MWQRAVICSSKKEEKSWRPQNAEIVKGMQRLEARHKEASFEKEVGIKLYLEQIECLLGISLK